MNHQLCKHYYASCPTSRGDVTSACVDDEQRTIRVCDYNPKTKKCSLKFEPRK